MTLIDLLSSSVRSQSRVRRFAPGEMIVREGEPGLSAFVLLAGECEVIVHNEVLSWIRPGELFGEIACLEGGTRTASVRAAAESDVLELGGDVLRSELQHSPMLLEGFLRAMAQRTRNISSRETVVRDEQRQLRQVLETLQPPLDAFRNHPQLSIEARWQPLTLASGDYYDVLEPAAGRILCALGDVMGHGAPTAPIVGMIRGQLHECAEEQARPHEILGHLHAHMRRHGHPNIFMTLTVMLLDLDSRTAEFACAGPPSPLLCRGGQSSPLTKQCGWTLGYPFEHVFFDSERLTLEPGDVFLFYSDGLSDAARNPDSGVDAMGTGALAEILRTVCSERSVGIPDAIFAQVKAMQAGRLLEDDATALAVTVL
jgi:serine phosphatase RsbU (regulator of sigma subunit)